MRIELVKEFTFEAAHLLPRLPKNHKCRRLHGHSFRVEVHVEGECNPKLGWLIDYAEIAQAFAPIEKKLDHYYLNDIPGLDNPTSENLARWIWERLKPKLPILCAIVVHETCNARAVYRGEEHRQDANTVRHGAGGAQVLPRFNASSPAWGGRSTRGTNFVEDFSGPRR